MSGWLVPGLVHIREVRADRLGRRVVARHHLTRRLVSVTYLSRELLADGEFRTGFRAEAARLGQLRHARVARVREFVECGDEAAVVADHVAGTTLRALLRAEGAVGTEAALAVFKDSLQGLAAGHAAGIAHGDLKPEDVVLTRAGRVRLVDFGFATCGGRRWSTCSSPFYLAAEQWSGRAATPAADVYAATAVLVECLVGGPPFHADTPAALCALHAQSTPPLHAVPEPVRYLVGIGLAKDPAHRPAARQFLAHLDDVAAHRLGAGWERRGRRELAGLLAGSAQPGRSAVPVQVRGPRGWELAQSVRLASALGGALLFAVATTSPPLAVVQMPDLPFYEGPPESTSGPPERSPARILPNAGSGAIGTVDDAADPASGTRPVGIALPGTARTGTAQTAIARPVAEAEPTAEAVPLSSARAAQPAPEPSSCDPHQASPDRGHSRPDQPADSLPPATPVLMSGPPTASTPPAGAPSAPGEQPGSPPGESPEPSAGPDPAEEGAEQDQEGAEQDQEHDQDQDQDGDDDQDAAAHGEAQGQDQSADGRAGRSVGQDPGPAGTAESPPGGGSDG